MSVILKEVFSLSHVHCSMFISPLILQLAWSKDIHDRLTRDELAKSVPEAESLLERHQERKVWGLMVMRP